MSRTPNANRAAAVPDRSAWRSVIRVMLAGYWLVLVISTHWPGLTTEDVPNWDWLPFDKTMHALTFAGLAMLLTWARPRPTRGAAANAIAAFVIGLVYGALEELTQPWFDRTGSWADLLADAVGLTVGATVGYAVWRLAAKPSAHVETAPNADAPALSGNDSGDRSGDDSGGGFVRHAKLVSLLTLVSRMTGLVRDAVLAAVFGATLYLDALLIGFLVPNLFRRLFGEGALTAAFVPRYTKLLKSDPALARRFASLCVVVVASLLAGITLVGEAGLWFALSQNPGEKASLALRLTMLMLPYMPLVCGVAFLGAILQVHKRFGPPAAAPIVLNLVMIGAALLALSRAGDEWSSVFTVALSVLIAGLLQLGWLGLVVLRAAPLTAAFAGTATHFRGMLVTMLPMVIGLGVFQINTLLDGLIAYGFAAPADQPDATFDLLGRTLDYPMQTGAVTTLTLAQRLYQFPLGVFGIAIATAIFPALAAAATAAAKRGDQPNENPGSDGDFADILRRGLRLTFFIGLPASVGLILVRVPLTRVFFEWNQFTADDAARSAVVLAGYASAVWAYSMTHVLTKAFYAVDDATTPLKVSAAMVGLNLALNLTLIWPLGVAGLAWSTAVSASLQTLLLIGLLRRHVDRPVDAGVWRSWRTTAGLTVVMGLAVGGALWAAGGFDPMALSKTASVGVLALGVGVGGAVYLIAARLAGASELRWLMKRG